MKKRSVILLVLSFLLFIPGLILYNFINIWLIENEFAHKKSIAECVNNGGMIPYTIILYEDNTFIIIVLNNLYEGTYLMSKEKVVLYFDDDYLEGFLCKEYKFSKNKQKHLPLALYGDCSNEIIMFYPEKGIGIKYY